MKKFLHLWNDSSVRIIAKKSVAGNGDAPKSSVSLSRNYLDSTVQLLPGVRTNSMSLKRFLQLHLVATQYSDTCAATHFAGLLFWLDQVNSTLLQDTSTKQAMVVLSGWIHEKTNAHAGL